ncbi:hypothetical protein RFI_28826 [Reticulomyxa filosa]|uniref:Uncharacterized protein n=1 Tax=Reticulomyxa filosa TaxID=46433 RepID=X6M3Q5_RETFI|nr:hypothetical protein RFI_28826 [Reticulomyxa filosa]|eukprot:ETO08559.1 hypothetical protein RFI_28826 [Reticulomyxa filosa]
MGLVVFPNPDNASQWMKAPLDLKVRYALADVINDSLSKTLGVVEMNEAFEKESAQYYDYIEQQMFAQKSLESSDGNNNSNNNNNNNNNSSNNNNNNNNNSNNSNNGNNNNSSDSLTIEYVRDKVKFNSEHVYGDSRLYYYLCAHDYYSGLVSEMEQQFAHNRVDPATAPKPKPREVVSSDNIPLHSGPPPPPPPSSHIGSGSEMLQLLRLQFRQRQPEQRRRDALDRERASGV